MIPLLNCDLITFNQLNNHSKMVGISHNGRFRINDTYFFNYLS